MHETPVTLLIKTRLERDELKRQLGDMERLADSYFRKMCEFKHRLDNEQLERLAAAGVPEVSGCGDAVCDLCYPRIAGCPY